MESAIILPRIAGYTVFSCRVFRGKVREALHKQRYYINH